jgi:hypothetical protein
MRGKNVILLLTAILMTSCASSRRISRVFEKETSEKSKTADRIPLLPLLYQSGEYTAILPPLFDKDKEGFAIRPLFNKEGDEYAFLFPFAAWNPVLEDGWFGPYVWNKDFNAIFPLFYKDDDKFISPLFFQNKDKWVFLNAYKMGDNAGLFPLFNKNSKEFWMWGLYGWEKGRQSNTHKVLFGLLGNLENKDNGDHTHYLFPYLSHKSNGSTTTGVLPLFFSKENDNGAYSSFLLPFYYYGKEANNDSSLFTLLGGYYKNANSTGLNVTPFWWSGSDKDSSYQLLFPLFYNNNSPKSSTTYLFPWLSNKDQYTSNKFLFPLFWSHSEFDKEGEVEDNFWTIFPLVFGENSKNKSSTKVLFGMLFNQENNKVKLESRSSLLGYLADWESNETNESSSFRFPAFFDWNGLVHKSKTKAKSEGDFLYLYSYEETPTSTKRDIFPGIGWDTGKDESGFSFLWRVFETHERKGKKGGHIFFIPWGDQSS